MSAPSVASASTSKGTGAFGGNVSVSNVIDLTGSGSQTVSKASQPAEEYEPYYCHQHKGGTCHGPPFWCTFLRPSGKRCGFRFCRKAMKEIGVDPDMLLRIGRNDLSIEPNHHTASLTPYYFQCPRCDGTCRCETCLQAPSAAPPKAKVSKTGASSKGWAGFMQESGTNQKKTTAIKTKSSTSKKATAKESKGVTPAKSKKAKEAGPTKGKAKESATLKAKAKSAPKGTKKDTDKNKVGGAAIKKAKGANGKVVKKFVNPRPPMPPRPKLVQPPALQTISTRLPRPNIEARIYLYETLVRLTDVIKVPKLTLSALDRFDGWTARHCQQLLERLLMAAAGLNSMDRGQPPRNMAEAVRAYRDFGSQPQRGEPWAAARTLVRKELAHDVEELAAVDRTADEEREREEEDRLAALAAAAEIPTQRVTRRMAAAERRLMDRHTSVSDTERNDSGGQGGRRTANSAAARLMSNGGRHPSSSLSRSRRRDLLGDSDADSDDGGYSDDSASQGSVRRGGRRVNGHSRTHVVADSDMSDAESVLSNIEDSAGSAYQASDDEGGSNQTTTITAATSPPESTDYGSKNKNAEAAAIPLFPEPLPAPHLEAKISILCGLCDVVLQTTKANKEIRSGVEAAYQAEREHKAVVAQLEKEWAAKKQALNDRAPSMTADTYADWKKERADAEREHKWELIQENVKHMLHLDTLKLRTGPIGRDLEGREYWQLSEYVEKMPNQTSGRWAWCLLVQGQPFPSIDEPGQSANGKKNDDADSTMSDLSSISTASNHSSVLSPVPSEVALPDVQKPFGGFDERGNPRNNFEVAIPVKTNGSGLNASSVPTAWTSISSAAAPANANAEGDGKVFMGTNYPQEIKQIMRYLKYRCDMDQYDKTVLQINRPEPFTAAEVAEQKAEHAKLREETEELLRALNRVKEYYIYHLGELDAID